MKIYILLILFTFNSVQSQTTWFSQNSGTTNNLNSIYFANAYTGYVVGELGIILKTTNGGINWMNLSIVEIGNNVFFKSIFFFDANTGIIMGGRYCCSDGFSVKTTNGGTNWINYNTFGGAMNSVFFISPNTGYSVGSSGARRISKSINGGNTWSSQFYDPGSSYNSVFFTDINTGFTVGESGIIFKTSNGGVNWVFHNSNVSSKLNSVQFLNDSIGFIAGDEGKILKTTNRGLNWNIISVLGITDNFNSLYFNSENHGFAVGAGGTIVKTTDGGYSWESVESASNQTLNSVFFANGEIGYAVGAEGKIVKTTNGGNSYSGITINLKLLIEGMYSPVFNQLLRTDTIKIFLRNSTPPFSLVDSAKGTIDSITHSGIFNLLKASTGTYYLTVKHFNSIETWSKAGGETLEPDGIIYNYDFTTANTQAYWNNLKLKGIKYCIYSGDANQDGFIDLFDLVPIYNGSTNFVTGNYLPVDLTGDKIVDLTDVTLCYNNSTNFIRLRRP